MTTQLTPVASSMISQVGYDDASNVLTIVFNNGRTYRYAGVPSGEYDNLLNASSVGSYFAANIKNAYRLA